VEPASASGSQVTVVTAVAVLGDVDGLPVVPKSRFESDHRAIVVDVVEPWTAMAWVPVRVPSEDLDGDVVDIIGARQSVGVLVVVRLPRRTNDSAPSPRASMGEIRGIGAADDRS